MKNKPNKKSEQMVVFVERTVESSAAPSGPIGLQIKKECC